MKQSIRLTILSTILAAIAVLLCSSVWAQQSKKVWFANSPLFTVHNGAGDLTLEQRVDILQGRANELLRERKTLPSITVRKYGMGSSIFVDNSLFTTVTPADAKSYGKTPTGLANYWAKNMRRILPQVRAQHNPNVENLSTGPSWKVPLASTKPYMTGRNLMLPFKQVMKSINIPFVYDANSKTIRANSRIAKTQHTVGTRTVNVNGKTVRMKLASRISNGTIYVPSSYINMLTGKTSYWNQRSKILRID